jgi:hypothetical protein
MSCDLLPTETAGPHYQGNVRDVLDYPWDLMIAHPPCTHLSVSGAKHFAEKRMRGGQQAAASFFMMLAKTGIPKIAIENPVCVMSSLWRKPDQTIQPWQFGHGETKATCLWLKNLPKLVPTNVVDKGAVCTAKSGKRISQCYYDSSCLPPKEREKMRNKTFQGIADAMAQQWGGSHDGI